MRAARWPLCAFCLALGGILSLLPLAVVNSAQGPLYALPTDRFGVGLEPDFGAITDYDVTSLLVGWYSDWETRLNPDRPAGIEYAQLIWVQDGEFSPGLDQLGPTIDNNPGSLWMIGNEPECVWQGNNTPEQYAAAYHSLYPFIKGRDPSAQVAIGGVVQPTPIRLQWLDRVLDHYKTTYGQPMPVDVWNIHVQILQELKGGWGCEIPRGLAETSGRLYGIEDNDSIEIFKQLIVEFRTWMRDRGQRGKPLLISEFGVLFPPEYGYTLERVNAFMNASFDYLLSARDADLGYPADEDRLVQRWLWYSLNDQPWDADTGRGFNGALFDYRYAEHPGVITPVGINFREYMEALAEEQGSAVPSATHPTAPAGSTTLRPAFTATNSVRPTLAPTATAVLTVAQSGASTALAEPTAVAQSGSRPTTPSGGGSYLGRLLQSIWQWLRNVYEALLACWSSLVTP